VLEASAAAILEQLPDDAIVLDVGGWASPFERADWVLDLLPYETRGLYGYDRATAVERFTEHTWVQRDICEHEPWPFADRQFDFVICSQTLEDVRDPVWVCRELQRVARGGYIECPSRAEEQTWGVHGPWVGWSHHRWLVDVVDGRLRFAFKPAVLHARDHFPAGHLTTFTDAERVVELWWNDRFEVEELQFVEPEDLHRYLRAVDGAEKLVDAAAAQRAARRARLFRRVGPRR
jgi:hypothetical protein